MNFINHVLKPMGMPLISAYFTLKGNTLINTAADDAAGAEAFGNWVLTPARYLLDGRRVTNLTIYPGNCQFAYIYTQTDPLPLELVKTVLGILSLGPVLAIGIPAKCLAALNPHVARRYEIIDAQSHPRYLPSHKPIPVCDGWFAPANPIPQFKLGDVGLPAKIQADLLNQQLNIHALSLIGKALNEANIPWWLDFGSLLGLYRAGRKIPWDEDIDCGIPQEFHDAAIAFLEAALPKEDYAVWDFSVATNRNSLIKVLVRKTGMLIDICHYNFNGDRNTMTYQFNCQNSWYIPEEGKKREPQTEHPVDMVFPLRRSTFESLEVFVPNNVEGYLKAKYGDNLAPCRVWSNQKQDYVKTVGHPYFLQSQYNY